MSNEKKPNGENVLILERAKRAIGYAIESGIYTEEQMFPIRNAIKFLERNMKSNNHRTSAF